MHHHLLHLRVLYRSCPSSSLAQRWPIPDTLRISLLAVIVATTESTLSDAILRIIYFDQFLKKRQIRPN